MEPLYSFSHSTAGESCCDNIYSASQPLLTDCAMQPEVHKQTAESVTVHSVTAFYNMVLLQR